MPAPGPGFSASVRTYSSQGLVTRVLPLFASRLWTTSPVEAASFAPVPDPGYLPALGGAYHAFGPAAFDPI